MGGKEQGKKPDATKAPIKVWKVTKATIKAIKADVAQKQAVKVCTVQTEQSE